MLGGPPGEPSPESIPRLDRETPNHEGVVDVENVVGVKHYEQSGTRVNTGTEGARTSRRSRHRVDTCASTLIAATYFSESSVVVPSWTRPPPKSTNSSPLPARVPSTAE